MPTTDDPAELKERIQKLEKELKEKDQVLQTLFSVTKDTAFIVTDINGENSRILDCNTGTENLFNYPKDELIGTPIIKLHEKKDKENFPVLMEKMSKGEKGFHDDLCLVKKDGEKFPARLAVYPVFDEKENLVRMLGIAFDVSDYYKVKHELEQEHKRYKTLFENTGTATCLFGDDSVIRMANKKFEELSGYSREELENQLKWSDFVSADDLEKMSRYHEQRNKQKGNPPTEYEFTFLNKKREKRRIRLKIGLIGDTKERVASLEDVSEFYKTREELKENQEIFEAFMSQLPGGVFIKDEESRLLYVNDFIQKRLGNFDWKNKTNDELFSKSYAEKISKDDALVFKEGFQRFYQSLPDEKGKTDDFETIKFRIDREGKKPLLGGIAVDVTNKLKIERELKRSEQKFSQLYHNSIVGMAFVRLDFEIVEANQAYCHMLGYNEHEMKGKKIWEFTHPEILEENMKKQEELVKGERDSYRIEKMFIHKKGHTVYGILNASLIRNEKGEPDFFIGQVIDVTDRKMAELNNLENRRRLEILISNLPGVVYRCINEREWTMKYLSAGIESLTGYKKDEIIDNNIISYGDIIHPDDKEYVWNHIQKNIEIGKIFEIEYRIITKDKKEKWVWEKGQAVLVDEKGYVRIEGFVEDITREKYDRQALIESEEKYRVLAETARDIIGIHDMNGKIRYLNSAALNFLGLRREEVEKKYIKDFLPVEVWNKMEFRKAKRKQGNKERLIYETEFINKEGKKMPVEVNSSPIIQNTGSSGVLIVARDITERKEYENELREKEQRYRILFETTGTATFVFGDDKVITMCNEGFEKLSGYSKKEIINYMKWSDFVHEDDLSRMLWYHKNRPYSNDVPREYDFRFVDKEHTLKYIHITIKMIPDSKERIASFLDITDLKETEEELKNNQERLALALEGGELGLWDWNTRTDYVFFSERWASMLGYKKNEIKPHVNTWKTMLHPEDEKRVYEELKAHLDGKTKSYYTEHRLKTKSGYWKWVSDKGKVVQRDEKGNPLRVIGVHQDISKRKKAEIQLKNWNKELENRVQERTAQLQETNKELESFSYSVSHDLKAPLRAIDGFSKILMEEIEQDISEDNKRYLKIIRDNALKMNQLITDLLSFSRLGRKALKEQQVNTVQLVKKVYQHEKVNLTNREHQFVLKPLPEVVADKRMLEIVFTNLISNAFKYTIDKEVAYVEVGFEQKEKKQVFYVKDNGVGFDMKYIDKVFGAFQRLHNDEKYGGSGIGLSIVQRIVNKHGGKIWAKSEPGKGSIFYFYVNPNN